MRREIPACVLGWHDSHCSSAALLDAEGRILFAAAEERYNKRKQYRGHPRASIAEARQHAEPDTMATTYCDLPLDAKIRRNLGLAWNTFTKRLNCEKSAACLTRTALSRIARGQAGGVVGTDERARPVHHARAQDEGATYDTLCEHHTAHAASAYYHSGFENAHVVTLDGVGDCLSCAIFEGRQGRLIRRKSFYYNEITVGADYETFTAMMGFNPDRHCGKITGLSARGRYRAEVIEALRSFFADSWRAGRRNYFDRMHRPDGQTAIEELRTLRHSHFGQFSREDLSYAMQYLAEQTVLDLILQHIPGIQGSNIALAGGVFANVRINQKIKQLGFANVFVQPAMDDGGLALGAALHLLARHGTLSPYRLPHVFLGPRYTDAEIEDTLDRAGLRYDRCSDSADRIAQLVEGGNVVARFDGAMEFGPRALGNRSILYDTRDPAVNDWLNRRLRRTEFMPFAPATLIEEADRCYRGLEGCEHAAEFMTMTFDCTPEMVRLSPAVVHVDGTARAQLVTPRANPGLHAILEAYHRRTGIPSLVNTSFNMHEAPIVMTPEDAIQSFQEGRLDYLALGEFIVSREANRDLIDHTEAQSAVAPFPASP